MDTVSKKAFWITTIILIILLALGVAGTWYYLSKKCSAGSFCKDQKAEDSSSESDKAQVKYKKYRYELATYTEGDQVLLQIDKEKNTRPVLIDSIKASVLEIGNNFLYLFADPQGSDLVFLTPISQKATTREAPFTPSILIRKNLQR